MERNESLKREEQGCSTMIQNPRTVTLMRMQTLREGNQKVHDCQLNVKKHLLQKQAIRTIIQTPQVQIKAIGVILRVKEKGCRRVKRQLQHLLLTVFC